MVSLYGKQGVLQYFLHAIVWVPHHLLRYHVVSTATINNCLGTTRMGLNKSVTKEMFESREGRRTTGTNLNGLEEIDIIRVLHITKYNLYCILSAHKSINIWDCRITLPYSRDHHHQFDMTREALNLTLFCLSGGCGVARLIRHLHTYIIHTQILVNITCTMRIHVLSLSILTT